MNNFNQQILSKYGKELGIRKMQSLWREFSENAEHFFENASKMPKTEIRLKFHNLRSGALVFGLEEFSSFCAEVEQEILQNISDNLLDSRIKEAKKIFKQQQQNIKTYWENHND